MFEFPELFNLGELSRFLTRFAGIWTMVQTHMNTVRALSIGLWLFVTAWAFYERFRDMGEDSVEYVYQILRSGLAFGALLFWPDLFDFFRTGLSGWADSIGYQASMRDLFQAIGRYLSDPVRWVLRGLIGPLSLILDAPFFIFLVAVLFFLFAYVYLLIYQSVSLCIAYIFGPIALALYPSQMAGKLTAGYLKATIKILLLPLLFAIFLDAFARISIDLFQQGNVGLVQSIILILVSYTTLKLPRILDRLDSGLDVAGHYASGLMVMTATYAGSFATGLALRGATMAMGAGVKGLMASAPAASTRPNISSPRVQNPWRFE